MKSNLLVAIALVASCQAAFAEEKKPAPSIYDEAFPKGPYFSTIEDEPFQGAGSVVEIPLGMVGTAASAVYAKELNLASVREEEISLATRTQLSKKYKELGDLLDKFDQAKATKAEAEQNISQLESELQNGRKVTIGSKTRYQELSKLEREMHTGKRDQLKASLPLLEDELSYRKEKAAPALRAWEHRITEMQANIRNNALGVAEKEALGKARNRLLKQSALTGTSLLLLVDGGLRLVNFINHRESGIVPALSLGAVATSRALHKGADLLLGAGAPADQALPRSGCDLDEADCSVNQAK